MIDAATLGTYVVVSLVLLVTPGPAVAFVLARSLAGGPRAGIVSQAGLCAGLLVHVVAASLGLSAVLMRSASALSVLRLLGAAYLVWLAVAAFRSGAPEAPIRRSTDRPPTVRLFLDGFVVDALNPKPAFFFLALLPQFIDPGAGSAAIQMVALGGLFVALAFLSGTLYAVVAGAAAARLEGSPRLRRWTRWGTGSIYLALATAAVASGRWGR